MPALLPNVDPDGLLEYSVVYTDRALNHMSQSFQGVMNDISRTLKKVYNAQSVAIVPGSGTFGMEAVARQFANDAKVLVLRNGYFSFRWSQIFESGNIPSEEIVMMARPIEDGSQAAYAPCPIDEVVAKISAEKPAVVFAPHVETSSGMILPDDYVKAVGDAAHAVGALFVLDCIASGTIWVDMEACSVDVLISAPQKGWSGPPCAGLVMMNAAARARVDETTSSSFACDLKKWLGVMESYEKGGHSYHTTMPTDALTQFRNVMDETDEYGFDRMKVQQQELGDKIRAVLVGNGIKSVSAEGFQAPGVVVSYTEDMGIKSGAKFAAAGMQIAGGVPLKIGEPEDFKSFRLGLFGLDKLNNVDRTVATFEETLKQIL